jgi:hypothetical protein
MPFRLACLLSLLLPLFLLAPATSHDLQDMAVAKGLGGVSRSLRVCLLTDVEGNWQYVRNVARQSACLRLVPRGGDASGGICAGDGYHDDELELRDGCMLVFGGDAGDKSGETLK